MEKEEKGKKLVEEEVVEEKSLHLANNLFYSNIVTVHLSILQKRQIKETETKQISI